MEVIKAASGNSGAAVGDGGEIEKKMKEKLDQKFEELEK